MSAKCGICANTVYAVDPQINLNGSIYHKICAKCVDCRCQITVSNFTKSGDTLLCKTHYMKRFNEQGTFLGAEKFKQQPVRGLAATNPAAEAAASSSSSLSSQKSFSEDSERSNSVKERMKKFASATSTPKCAICERSVYANDPQIVLDGLSYHRGCAKCTECKCQITISNFNKSGSTLFCTTHYLKRFHEDGTIIGAEKFTHQSAPGKFAGSGFTIPISESSASTSSSSGATSNETLPPPPENSSSTSSSTTTTQAPPPPSQPEPAAQPAPAPAPEPEPAHQPAPEPEPEPVREPSPEPTPEPAPETHPEEPAPQSQPEEHPEAHPEVSQQETPSEGGADGNAPEGGEEEETSV